MLDILNNIADRVARTVGPRRHEPSMGEELEMGADGTPTLFIDRLAEEVILDYVRDEGLPWDVLSEEAGQVGEGGERTLVIDPIDGTYNAIMGIPLYSVSLALGKKSMADVDTAVVLNLVTGDRYSAIKGEGARLNGRPIHTRTLDMDQAVFLVYMGRFATEDDFRMARSGRRCRSLGCSSLELSLVAQGSADAYYLHTDSYGKAIRVVDIAAAALILREAGGDLVDLKGKVLDMPFDLAVRSNFLAYGDASMREVLR